MKKFTKDPVETLLTKVTWFYSIYKEQNKELKDMNEYDVIREIINVVERNNGIKKKKTNFQLIKND